MSTSYELSLFTFSHLNTTVEERDRLAFTASEIDAFLPELRARFGGEAAIVSTCNRTEFYLFGTSRRVTWDELAPEICASRGIRPKDCPRPASKYGQEAARHLMRVAASLESLALGEDQILRQVKDAHERVLASPGKSPALDQLFQFAVQVGKRVREETALCAGAVSISSVSVGLTRRIFARLDQSVVALIGAGETCMNAATHFKGAGVRSFLVVNRGRERGERAAEALQGRYVPLDRMDEAIAQADICVFATGSREHLLTRKMMRQIMRARSHRLLFIVDISNPRNVDPLVHKEDGVILYNIDDLKDLVEDNLKERAREIPRAERVIEEVMERWEIWVQSLRVRPTIGRLHKHFHAVRQQELERHQHRLSPEELELYEQLSAQLIKKLLHNPIMYLRHASEDQRLRAEELNLVWDLHNLHALDDHD